MKHLLLPIVLSVLCGCAALRPVPTATTRLAVPRIAAHMSATAGVTIVWKYTPATQYTDGNLIPAGTAATFNLYTGVAGPGSEGADPTQTGIRYSSAVTSGYTSGENVCGFVTEVISAIESPHSTEACTKVVETPASPATLVATPQ